MIWARLQWSALLLTVDKKALFVIETIMDPGDFDPWGPRGFDDKATYYILSERANPDIWIILCTFILLMPIIALHFSIS